MIEKIILTFSYFFPNSNFSHFIQRKLTQNQHRIVKDMCNSCIHPSLIQTSLILLCIAYLPDKQIQNIYTLGAAACRDIILLARAMLLSRVASGGENGVVVGGEVDRLG